MRILLLLMAAIFSSLSLYAQDYTSVKGIAIKDNLEKVILYEIKYGSLVEIASSQVTPDGNYGFLFKPQRDGFYIVGKEDISRNRIYVKCGDKIELNIYNDTTILTPNNTPENKKLYEWETTFDPIKRKALSSKYIFFNHVQFFPVLEEMQAKAENYKSRIRTKNRHFNQLMSSAVDYDMDYYAISYLNTPKLDRNIMKPFVRLKPEEYPPYYSTIVTDKMFSDGNILNMDYGAEFLDKYSSFANIISAKKDNWDNKLENIPTDELKAELLIFRSVQYTDYNKFIAMQGKYEKYFKELHHTQRLGVTASKIFKGEDGGLAADFTYPDADGKMVSLSDFKGKYVLVDVWATWCGPCMAEVPYLKKLEEELNGTDVVFMGVSLDEKSDHAKWKQTLVDKQLKGIQLFASGWSKIAKDYQIKGIPRFMLFDRDGKIIKLSAPRPSNPELKALLLELLKK